MLCPVQLAYIYKLVHSTGFLMPKKENTKAVEARAKKEDSKRAADAKQKAQEEDREWSAAGDGAKTKAQAKKQDQVRSSCCLVESRLRPWFFRPDSRCCPREQHAGLGLADKISLQLRLKSSRSLLAGEAEGGSSCQES